MLQQRVDEWAARKKIGEALKVRVELALGSHVGVFDSAGNYVAFVNFSHSAAKGELTIYKMYTERLEGRGLMTLLQASLFEYWGIQSVKYWNVDGGEVFINKLQGKGILGDVAPERAANGIQSRNFRGAVSQDGVKGWLSKLLRSTREE